LFISAGEALNESDLKMDETQVLALSYEDEKRGHDSFQPNKEPHG
jgi:hypothetical protein